MLQQLYRVVGSTISKELKIAHEGVVPKLFSAIVRIAAIAWIARSVGGAAAVTYLAFGAAMMMVWSGVIATGGWVMSDEMSSGTLDFALISKAPLPILLFSRILATALYEMPSAIISMITVFLVAGTPPQAENALMLAVSFLLAIISTAVIGFFFCVLIVLVGGRAGFFMGIVPFGTVLGGFILPMEHMPSIIRGISMCVPSSWAMNGLWLSVNHGSDWGKIMLNLLACVVLSAAWLFISHRLCRRGERWIIVSGDLSRQW